MQLPNNYYNKSIHEKDIQNSIIELLKYHGYFCWRNNTGASKYRNSSGYERWVRFGQPGFSDIFAIQPRSGKFIGIEVKRDAKHKPTPAQTEFLNQVNAKGGIGFVAWSIEQVAERLDIKLLI